MKKNFLFLQPITSTIIYILTICFLTLTIYTIFLNYKLKKLKSSPQKSIDVPLNLEEPSIPTFNKVINYLGSDSDSY